MRDPRGFGTPATWTFRLEARKGDVWIVDGATARSPRDRSRRGAVHHAPDRAEHAPGARDRLRRPGRRLAGKRFPVGSTDPLARLVGRKIGSYLVTVRDRDGSPLGGSQTLPYRLRIRPERPDFDMFVVPQDPINPEAATLRAGGRTSVYVLAHRRDGLQGPIRVQARDLPSGVSCDPVVIPAGQASAPLVFSAEPGPDRRWGHPNLRRNLSADRKEILTDAKGKRLETET